MDQFPGMAVESVTDSSRYFVVRIEDGNGTCGSWCSLLVRRLSLPREVGLTACCLLGRRAFIGIGFGDRGDAFDFNVALQDHFK